MSANDSTDDRVESFLRRPGRWVVGAVGSIIGVVVAVVGDPISAFAALVGVVSDLSTALFTATSIAGFTIAPQISPVWAQRIQWAAIFFGLLVVAGIVDRVWERIKTRLTDD